MFHESNHKKFNRKEWKGSPTYNSTKIVGTSDLRAYTERKIQTIQEHSKEGKERGCLPLQWAVGGAVLDARAGRGELLALATRINTINH